MSKAVKIITAAFLIGSCSVGPDYQQPHFFDNEQIGKSLNLSAKEMVVPSRDWYKSLQDENLNKLIETAMNNAPDIATAYEQLRQSRINSGLAKAEWGPEISATGNYNQGKAFENTDYKSKSSYYQSGFDASWEIDIWGEIRRLNESKTALMRAAEADLDNVKIVLTAEIAANYINYRQNEKNLQITKQNLKLQQDIYQIVKQKHDAGLTDDLSLEQARSAVLNTETQLPSLRAAVNSYKANIALLCGKLPHQLELNEVNLLNKNPQISLKDVYKIPADIIRNRPDVKAAEQNLIAQNALIGNRIAAIFPSLSLSGFLGWQNKSLAPFIGSDYQIYNLASTIDMPLLDWKKRINQVKLQESITKQALIAYQKSMLSAVNDINRAMKNLTESSIRVENNQKNKNSQAEILTLSLQKYKNGLIEFSDVLTAEQNKLSAEQQYIESLGDWYLNFISFNKSVGAGFAITHTQSADQKDVANECDEPDKH